MISARRFQLAFSSMKRKVKVKGRRKHQGPFPRDNRVLVQRAPISSFHRCAHACSWTVPFSVAPIRSRSRNWAVVRLILIVTASSNLRYSLRSSNIIICASDSRLENPLTGTRGVAERADQKGSERKKYEPLKSERLWQVAGETCTTCDD